MALVGIQALSHRNSSYHFCIFQNINLQNFSVTWNKINTSLDLLISYPSITQTQINYMLPTRLKFRVNPYIKIVLSKTQENLRLKTWYLKGITTEQLFIISISRDYLQSPFYSALKNRKLDTHFYFIFSLFRSHLTIIYIANINFYFVLTCYASFYDSSKYIENSKIVKPKRERNTLLDTWGVLLP